MLIDQENVTTLPCRMTMTQAETLLTSADAARRLGVTPATVRLWERFGRIPATRTLSGTRLFRESDVQRLAEQRAREERRGR